jgi:hypothetical protein
MATRNLVLITSVIRITDGPYNYSETRSVFSHSERYEQTKRTIESVREKIPNSTIFIIECSPISQEEREYLVEHSEIFINLFDLNDFNINYQVSSISKSLGEGIMTINALKYIIENNIEYDSLYKVSGRYWLNDNFIYDNYNNDAIVTRAVENVTDGFDYVYTCVYKLPRLVVPVWLDFLYYSMGDMYKCVSAEVIFATYVKNIDYRKKNLNPLGLSGIVAVDSSEINV